MLRSILKNIPIKFTAPLLVAAPVLVAVVLLSVIAFLQGRWTANNLASQNMKQIHGRIEERIEGLIEMPPRINRLNEQLIRDGKLNLDDLQSWQKTIAQQKIVFDDLTGIMWGGADGRVVWLFRYPGQDDMEFAIQDNQADQKVHYFSVDSQNGVMAEQQAGEYEFDPRVRPWYLAGIEAGKPTWSPPYTYLHEELSKVTVGLPFVQPYRDENGEILGIIESELSLDDFSEFLSSLTIGKTGIAFVMDRDGFLLANSTGSKVIVKDDTKNDFNRLAAIDSDDARINEAARRIKEQPDTINQDAPVRVEVNGEPFQLVVSEFEHETGLEWLIVTSVPESDFMSEVEASRNRSIIISLIIIALALGFGVVLAIAMVRPFMALVDNVRTIGGGDLEHEVQIDDTPEFARLSKEINHMTAELREGVKMRHALELASDVQTSLLPTEIPEINDLDISGHSTYCDETGGDYYDFLEIGSLTEGQVVLALGDVMGHGAAAAMLMATARGILRSRTQAPGTMAELLTHMNRLLAEDTGGSRFMTMILVVLDLKSGQGRMVSAGHDMPIVYDPENDEFAELPDEGGLPLGLIEDEVYEEMIFPNVRSNQVYLIATDGLWEAYNSAGEQYGLDRLKESVRRHAKLTAEEINAGLLADFNAFLGDANPHDDVTFIVAKVR